MDYVECVTFSLQVGVFFLMQSFWNYLSNTVAKKSFMGSFEFKFYILWYVFFELMHAHKLTYCPNAGLSEVWPCFLFFNGCLETMSVKEKAFLNWLMALKVQYTRTERERERSSSTVPMWKYLINKLVALITSLLGVRSHFRFKRIIALSHRNNGASNKAIVTRLAYFKDMNVLISIILFFYAASFIVLCSDGLTDHKIINSNKFATDTIIANVNICTVFLWLLLVR